MQPSTLHNPLTFTTTSSSTALQSTVLTFVDTFFRTAPYTAAALTCGIKAFAADSIAQQRTKQALLPNADNKNMDIKRSVAFVAYGSLYQGVTQEFVYNHVYPQLFGCGTSVSVVLAKVLFDLLIQTTLVTLPIAYLTKAAIFKYSIGKALSQYVNDIREHGLLKKYFMLWGPVQCLTFSVVPEHYRVSFIACVSFFWLIILSTISSRSEADVAAKVSAAKATTVSVKALEKLVAPKDPEREVAAIGE